MRTQMLHGSSESPYDAEDLEIINENKGRIVEELFINRVFKLDVYSPLDRTKCYFIGVDVANGYGSDNTAVTVFDPYELKPVAEFKSPNIGVKNLIEFLYVLVRKHLPRSILIVERNANGEAVLDHLRATDISMNLYWDNSKDFLAPSVDGRSQESIIEREAKQRKLYGVWTGSSTRPQMFALLEGHIKDYKKNFVCANIINDILKLVRKNTKIEAGPGAHDDSVMSYLMCLYVYYYGNNLARYGYVRGALPAEEERNKGLTYADVQNYLSDVDKKFFEGVAYQTMPEYQVKQQKIGDNGKGLITDKELKIATGERLESSQPKTTVQALDPYSAKIHREYLEAQRESEEFNSKINFKNSYQNMDVDTNSSSSFTAGLFSYLND